MSMTPINVVSLFDGISCGKLALERAGVPVNKYYSSEIDEYALFVSKRKSGSQIRLGDFLAWRSWLIDYSQVSLVLAGFPCQARSLSGYCKGTDDERGAIFLELIEFFDHVKKINPNVKFLFENVRTTSENIAFLSSRIGCEPIEVCSSLVSAQTRKRLYWTNLEHDLNLEHDDGPCLMSVLEPLPDADDVVFLSDKTVKRFESYGVKFVDKNTKKARCLSRLEYKKNGKQGNYLKMPSGMVRKLTPVECERLQTLPDNYTLGLSKTQRYMAIGNAWTVDVIASFFRSLLYEN